MHVFAFAWRQDAKSICSGALVMEARRDLERERTHEEEEKRKRKVERAISAVRSVGRSDP